MKSSGPFHLFSTNDCSNFHESFNIVVGLEQGKLPSEEEQQNHACRPDINGYGETMRSRSFELHYIRILPPVCSLHLSKTSGARKPLVPARFAFEMGLEYGDVKVSWLEECECMRLNTYRESLSGYPTLSAGPADLFRASFCSFLIDSLSLSGKCLFWPCGYCLDQPVCRHWPCDDDELGVMRWIYASPLVLFARRR